MSNKQHTPDKLADSKQAPSLSPSWKRYLLHAPTKFLSLWLAPFLILQGFFLMSLMNQNNYAEVFPAELIFPTLMYVIAAVIIAIVAYYSRRPTGMGAKLFMTIVLGSLLVDYDGRLMNIAGVFRAIVPILPKSGNDLPIISVLFLISLFFFVRWVGILLESAQKRYTQLTTTNIIGGSYILLIVLVGGQFVGILRALPSMIKESSVQPPSLGQSTTRVQTEKPDIYYFVLDRYTNDSVLTSQFNFDNTSFTNYLREQGFLVNDHAYSNYPYTTMSISSTMNATYTNTAVAPYKDNTIQSRALYHNLIRQSSVVKALKDSGYKYYAIGSWYGASNKNPLANRDYMWDHLITILGKEKRLRGIENVEFSKSVFYRFFMAGNTVSGWPLKVQDHNYVDDVTLQLAAIRDITTKESPGGRFVFAHILVPHDPFLFNADGSLATAISPDNVDKPIKQKYLGQVQFINSQMRQIINNIQEQSKGKAIIVLNSDEGAYPQVMNSTALTPAPSAQGEGGTSNEDMSGWPVDWLKMKYGILQAAYIPDANQEDLANLSSVNLFRVILNNTLGYSLPYLPNCNFALNVNSNREYNYIDITKTLSGIEDSQCKQYQSIPASK